jgi:hypothetical protein
MSTEKKSLEPCYEAHLTYDQDWSKALRDWADDSWWVFSEISGCPILGQGTYCYLTGYDPDPQILLDEMNANIEDLRLLGMEPLRAKIEHIVYDTKTGRNELTPAA